MIERGCECESEKETIVKNIKGMKDDREESGQKQIFEPEASTIKHFLEEERKKKRKKERKKDR